MILGYCGDDCESCPRYIATKDRNKNELERLSTIWKKVGWQDETVSAEDFACSGCSPVNSCLYRIAKCASERRIDNCGQCVKYPCPKVLKAFERTKIYAEKCKALLSKEDYDCLHKAFFLKKDYLDEVNKKLR